VRDRAQRAAHDVAKLEALPSEGLRRRRDELGLSARREADDDSERERLREWIGSDRARLAELEARRQQVGELPRRERRPELERIEQEAAWPTMRLSRNREALEEMPAPSDVARRELAAVEAVLAQRERMARAATRLSPPAYLTAELGERPADLAKARAWDQAALVVNRYRERNGIEDRAQVFGVEPRDRAEKAERRAAVERVRRLQRQLGRERDLAQGSVERGMGLGR
jgi:hypothetical protein